MSGKFLFSCRLSHALLTSLSRSGEDAQHFVPMVRCLITRVLPLHNGGIVSQAACLLVKEPGAPMLVLFWRSSFKRFALGLFSRPPSTFIAGLLK